MKIYTRTGDAGQTGVIGGRVGKNDIRIEAYGTIDELNCFIGQAASLMNEPVYRDMKADLLRIQHELFDCGADLARLNPSPGQYKVEGGMIERLEAWIDRYEAETPPLTRFIMPGGSPVSAALHVCRAVCRRAERRVVALAESQPANEEVRRYLNRLSDLFFTMARAANVRENVEDVQYIQGSGVYRESE